jgi:hypothetical protein
MRALAWAAIAFSAAAVLIGGQTPAPAADASGSAVTVEIDPAAVPVGGTAVIPIRVTSGAPGVGGLRIDVRYDASRLTVLACAPASYCSIDAVAPQTVRLATLNFGGITGERVQVGSLTVQASGPTGQTDLLIDRDTAQVYDTLANKIADAVLSDGHIDVVGSLLQGDVDCSGGLTASDALAVLAQMSNAAEPVPGCTPAGNVVNGALWGDVTCDGAVDGLDALAIVLAVSGKTPPGICAPV